MVAGTRGDEVTGHDQGNGTRGDEVTGHDQGNGGREDSTHADRAAIFDRRCWQQAAKTRRTRVEQDLQQDLQQELPR